MANRPEVAWDGGALIALFWCAGSLMVFRYGGRPRHISDLKPRILGVLILYGLCVAAFATQGLGDAIFVGLWLMLGLGAAVAIELLLIWRLRRSGSHKA